MDRHPPADVENGRDTLRALLRGEIAATETYRQAIERLQSEGRPEAKALQSLHAEHVAAFHCLRRSAVERGEETVASSGAWGAFAKAVEGTARVFGNGAALQALKSGEEHGTSEYERALERSELAADVRHTIANEILPKQRLHAAHLERLCATF